MHHTLGAGRISARRASVLVIVVAVALAAVVSSVGAAAPADTPPRPGTGAGRGRHPERIEVRRIGTSVAGRPIHAHRYGQPGGVVVLVAGAIHGDERSGRQIALEVQRQADDGGVPAGIDLWIIPAANPDGLALGTRQNARGVDLNRNFPTAWHPIACPSSYCSGWTPGSEPETQALMRFIRLVHPTVAVWWHSTGRVVDSALSGVADPGVLHAYAGAVGYSIAAVRCGVTTTCTGNATQFGNAHIPGATHFVVELPIDAPSLAATEVRAHIRAVWAAARAAG